MKLPGKHSVIGEAATLVSGNVLAQAIALLAYLILTRIFSPTDFALFNIFYSYIEVLIILSTCKYELAVVVARDETEAAAISRFALRMNTWVSLALLTLVAVLYLTNSLPGNFSQIGPLSLLIPPMVYFSGTSRVYAALFNRARHYRRIAASAIVNSVAGALFKIGFGLMGFFRSGMPLGTVIGQAVANLVYRFQLSTLYLPSTKKQQCTDAARRHRNFPLFVATKDFINSLSANLPFLWLAFYFDKAEVGLFALALTFTFRPVNLINSNLERVLYARIAEGVRKRQSIVSSIRRFLVLLYAVALPVFVIIWFAAEPVFTFLFGDKWNGSGIYVQTLLPWLFVALSSTTLTFISNIFSTQRTEFLFYLTLLALRAAGIGFGIAQGSFLLAIRLFSVASALVGIAILTWYLLQVRRYERSIK